MPTRCFPPPPASCCCWQAPWHCFTIERDRMKGKLIIGRTVRSTLLPAQFLVAALLASAGAARASDCQLGCRSDSCSFDVPSGKIDVARGQLRQQAQCEEVIPRTGDADIRYRHKGRW